MTTTYVPSMIITPTFGHFTQKNRRNYINHLEISKLVCNFVANKNIDTAMDNIKITREEAKRRWSTAKETKRRMVERLENLARESYKEQTGEYPVGVEVW